MLTRLQIACMTPKTRLDYDGAKIERTENSIHWTTNRKIRSKLCSMPPRHRNGEEIGGGRHLRRSTKKLASRIAAFEAGDTDSHTKPGAMR